MSRVPTNPKSEAERRLASLMRAGQVIRVEPIDGTTPMLLVRVRSRTPEIEEQVNGALRDLIGWRVEIAEVAPRI